MFKFNICIHYAYYSVERALEPVIVDAFGQVDDVTFLESQLALILGVEVVQSLATRLRCNDKKRRFLKT